MGYVGQGGRWWTHILATAFPTGMLEALLPRKNVFVQVVAKQKVLTGCIATIGLRTHALIIHVGQLTGRIDTHTFGFLTAVVL